MESRTENLSDILHNYWQDFIETVPRYGLAILIVIAGILLSRWITGLLSRRLKSTMEDPLMGGFIVNLLKFAFFIVSLMIGLEAAGLSGIAGGLLAAAGATTIVLGFAFKDIGENFLAGIILAFSRPFKINDAIKVGDTFGEVKSLDLRYTHIKTYDGRDVFLPNSILLQQPVENFTRDGFYRMDFVVGIDYDNDVEAAIASIMKVVQAMPDIIQEADHEPFVITDQLATSTVNLKAYFWVDTTDYRKGALQTRGKLIQNVKKQLLEEGFGLPADIQEIKFYNGDPFPIKTDYSEQATRKNNPAS